MQRRYGWRFDPGIRQRSNRRAGALSVSRTVKPHLLVALRRHHREAAVVFALHLREAHLGHDRELSLALPYFRRDALAVLGCWRGWHPGRRNNLAGVLGVFDSGARRGRRFQRWGIDGCSRNRPPCRVCVHGAGQTKFFPALRVHQPVAAIAFFLDLGESIAGQGLVLSGTAPSLR